MIDGVAEASARSVQHAPPQHGLAEHQPRLALPVQPLAAHQRPRQVGAHQVQAVASIGEESERQVGMAEGAPPAMAQTVGQAGVGEDLGEAGQEERRVLLQVDLWTGRPPTQRLVGAAQLVVQVDALAQRWVSVRRR